MMRFLAFYYIFFVIQVVSQSEQAQQNGQTSNLGLLQEYSSLLTLDPDTMRSQKYKTL